MTNKLTSAAPIALAAGFLILGLTAAHADGTVHAVQGELSVGYSSIEETNISILDDDAYPIIEGGARWNIPVSSDFAFQLDVDGLATFTDREDGEDNLQTAFTGGAHLAYRQPGSHALGIFGAVGSSNGGEDENATFGMIGLEGQFSANGTTIIGQAGYFSADDETENDVMTDAWVLRGVARYFLAPDQRLQAELTYASGEEDDSSCCDIDAWDWGVRYDQRFQNSPVGWAIGYRGTQVENDNFGSSKKLTEHTAFLALTFTFGFERGLTLQENNDIGATWDLPAVDRFTGYTTELAD